ncbi:putative disease resistance protein [Prunus yedoensis var. nudiflora]|uniref:Putative disease resistance protein n=1 Tax=Prunus yedoensis var. nudiflora TaxID=2094558 RepID=A0A314YMH2_PRUYE|nr:putative disease resistance protein [Prunus yedoensis var. nudiflora]
MSSASKGVVPWNIVLSCPNIYKLRLLEHITELPEDLLCLSGFGNLKDDHIKVLEKLPSLRMLFANFGNFPASLVCSKGGFPFLEFLSLDWFSEFKEWKVEKGAMPSLCRLQIGRYLALEAVPDGLQYITTLKELTIDWMPSEFCSRLREGGEDFYKIQHVEKGTMPSHCRLHIVFCVGLEAVPNGLQYITTLKELTIKWMPYEFFSRLGERGEDFYKIQHASDLDDFVKLTNLRKLGVITFDGGERKEKGTNIIFKHLHSLSVSSAMMLYHGISY